MWGNKKPHECGVTNYFSLFCVSVVYIKDEGGYPKDWVGRGVHNILFTTFIYKRL